MVGSFVCTDTSKLEEFGFLCHTRCDGSRFYSWVANEYMMVIVILSYMNTLIKRLDGLISLDSIN